MFSTIIWIIILVVIVALVVRETKIGKRIWARANGTADEMMIKDANTPEGAAAYYNSVIEAKQDSYTKAVEMLGQMTGKIATYEQQLRECKKAKMQYDLDIKKCIDSGDDEAAKVYIRRQVEADEQIQILKQGLAELKENETMQKEIVNNLREEVDSLKAEKEKSVLALETSQVIKSLKVDPNAATTEEEKMLAKVRDGVQKSREEATGHKIAYENSASVQQKCLDQRMKDADIEAKLQELKNATKNN